MVSYTFAAHGGWKAGVAGFGPSCSGPAAAADTAVTIATGNVDTASRTNAQTRTTKVCIVEDRLIRSPGRGRRRAAIVQRVSGKSFDQYVQDNIYTPLNMQRSTFVQPLPDNLKPMMSNGYKKASEKAQPFEFVEAYPAGSVSTTAQDMCNFMIAHLQDGKFGDA